MEEAAAPALLQSRSTSHSTRQSLALEIVLEDMEALRNVTLVHDRVVAAGFAQGYDEEGLMGLGKPATVVLDREGKELTQADMTNGSGVDFPARIRFTFPEPGAALAEGGEPRARNSDDYAALGDTLAALKAEDSTAGYLVETYHPVFDMDGDSCLPSAAVSRTGTRNPGVPLGNGLTYDCRAGNFMSTSNTYHRWDRTRVNGDVWEAHLYELYFEKDDASIFDWWWYTWRHFGHTHDVETVIMLFRNNQPKYVGVSAHGYYSGDQSRHWNSVPKQGNHPKVVYHKHGVRTHALRFAHNNEGHAENPTHAWDMPPLASWFKMTGSGKSNADMRHYLNSYSYGSANFKVKDSSCQGETDLFCKEVDGAGTYTPFFDFGLTTGTETRGRWFSDEGTARDYCPQGDSQSLLAGLSCAGHYCDNLRLHCSYKEGVSVGSEGWTGWFSNEQGLRTCSSNYVITGIRCSGRYCDKLKLQCKQLAGKSLDYSTCRETGSVSEEQGYVGIPAGGYPVGIRCSGRYCDNKKLRYCNAA